MGREEMEWHLATCRTCQLIHKKAEALRGKKLGKHERALLLEAATPESRTGKAIPPGGTHSRQVALRRAVATLNKAGLLRVVHTERGVRDPAALALAQRKWLHVRFMGRTVLGQQVVQRYRPELETGKPIRWDNRLDQARDAAVRWHMRLEGKG